MWHIENHQKHNTIEKVMAPKIGGVKNSKKKSLNIIKANSQTLQKNSLYVVMLLLEFKDDL
jgi:hypothetical protein